MAPHKISAALRHGGLEGVEVDHQEIDRPDAVRVDRRSVFLVVTDRQQPAMHLGMQRLDPAVHHLGKTGQLRDVHDVEAGILVVAFLESDIVIGVTAVEAEIGNECDVVRRVYRPAWDNETNERNNRGASDRLHVGHGCISHLGLRNRENLDPYRSITPCRG
jgi:hypothetical protein